MGFADVFRQRIADFIAPAPPKPTFTPEFDPDVAIVETATGNICGTVAEMYCATYATAVRLMGILDDLNPFIEMRTPMEFSPLSPTRFSDLVPWLIIKGKAFNAGLLANAWVVNSDYGVAERYCREEIRKGLEYQG